LAGLTLGRIMNVIGEPIDHKGEFSKTSVKWDFKFEAIHFRVSVIRVYSYLFL
jgi:F0F1-type ATP synthase beta subunit